MSFHSSVNVITDFLFKPELGLNPVLQSLLGIKLPQRFQPDVPFAMRRFHRNVFSGFDLILSRHQMLQQFLKRR